MFNIDEIIGDVVFISFNQPDKYINIGIKLNYGHFLLKGYDHIGVWLEHPCLEIIHNIDQTGKPLPDNIQKKEIIPANFMVVWSNIDTIMHYPGREGFDFPNEYAKKNIGFKIVSDNNGNIE